jgi:hypothetical protein
MSDFAGPDVNAVPVEAPEGAGDPAVEAARVRLAEWLTAQAPSPDLATTPEELADWPARPVEEFLLFIAPGYSNQLFLVSDRGITPFAPSQTTLTDAVVVARSAG